MNIGFLEKGKIMSSENYKLFREHKVEIFDMIYDTIERAPVPTSIDFFFGTETKEEREEFDKKMAEYLKIEEPKIREGFRKLGCDIK